MTGEAIYFETSALLAWLFSESRGANVRASLDAAKYVATSSLTLAEAERAFVRLEGEGALRAGDTQRYRGTLARARTQWLRLAISDDVIARASAPFPVEPVRTLDAIHLATALSFTKALPDIRVVSLDRRIMQNAEALGIG